MFAYFLKTCQCKQKQTQQQHIFLYSQQLWIQLQTHVQTHSKSEAIKLGLWLWPISAWPFHVLLSHTAENPNTQATQNTAKWPRFLWQEKCVRSQVHFEHHSIAQWFDNILTVEWHNYQEMNYSVTGQKLLGLETNCKIQHCCQGTGISFTWISCIVSSSLVSVFFSIPSPRSKASRVVLSDVNPSFFRGRSTSEKQNTLTVCISPRAANKQKDRAGKQKTDSPSSLFLSWRRILQVLFLISMDPLIGFNSILLKICYLFNYCLLTGK